MKKASIDKELKNKIDQKRHWRTVRNGTEERRQRLNNKRSRRQKAKSDGWHDEVKAPPLINLYDEKDHERTVDFLKSLRRAVSRSKKVRICFRDTKQITVSAGLLFISELDRLVRAFPDVKFSCIRPPVQHSSKFGNETYTVEAVLNQIGFFQLTKIKQRQLPIYPNVSCWKHSQGTVAEGEIAGKLLNHVDNELSPAAKRRLYRGAIEAISNCVDHAYPSARPDGLDLDDKRWWMFVGIMMGRLVVAVCDLGVGIPTTVPQKHSWDKIRVVLEKLKLKGTRDSEMIHASTYLRSSRTEQSHRGKGGKDIRDLLNHYPGARLTIYSNKGCFHDKNTTLLTGQKYKVGALNEQKRSILGTIIEWSVPLEELAA